MKIIHILEDYTLLSGGIRTVVKNLHEHLLHNNHNSLILAPNFENGDQEIVKFHINKKYPWCYSTHFKKILNNLLLTSKIDAIHIHGVWMFPQYYACKFALKHRIPYIISFHGMYEPWLWTTGYYKKLVYSNLLTNTLFNKASAIHSITNSETKDLQNRFKNVQVVEIPNLINVNQVESKKNSYKKSNYILFLGRLDPKKGIPLLIKAYSQLNQKNKLKLKIAGPLNEYQKVLQNQIKQLSLQDHVEFLGSVNGKDKQRLFEEALIFVSPSFSEVIGMVNLEAALSKTVVITTLQTGLNRAWNQNGGFLINPEIEEIKKAIETVLSWNKPEREEKENQLKNFVIKNYSWENRYQDWVNLYNLAIKNNG